VFVGSGIFKSEEPAKMAAAVVKAVTHYRDPAVIAEVSRGIGEPMRGRSVASLESDEQLAARGI
jgi:pyridoxal 5'-phosphate synthase pdxS subunit